MDFIGDLLPDNLRQTPDEFQKVKDFISTRYGVSSVVAIAHESLIITVPDSAVAIELRMNHLELQTTCDIDPKFKLVFRINPTI